MVTLLLPLMSLTLTEPEVGRALLESALAQRTSIRTGRVQVERNWDLPEFTIVSKEVAYFDESHYRVDVFTSSGLPPELTKHAQQGAPLLQYVWQGDYMMEKRWEISRYAYNVKPIGTDPIRFYNARLLGLTPRPKVLTSLEPLFWLDAEILGVTQRGDEYDVKIRLRRPQRSTINAVITLNSAKNWGVTGYTIKKRDEDTQYVLKGAAELQQFGDVWYPRFFRHEQYRDGKYHWSVEYLVVDAEFNEDLDPDTFTWDGLNTPSGTDILSSVPGITFLHWTGSEALVDTDSIGGKEPLKLETVGNGDGKR